MTNAPSQALPKGVRRPNVYAPLVSGACRPQDIIEGPQITGGRMRMPFCTTYATGRGEMAELHFTDDDAALMYARACRA
jgi:hypothetical protein